MKDAKGHGSNAHGGSLVNMTPGVRKDFRAAGANAEKHRAAIKSAGWSPTRLGQGWLVTHNTTGESFRATSLEHGASQVTRTSTGGSDKPFDPSTGFGLQDRTAAQALSSGSSKSDPVPVHSGASGRDYSHPGPKVGERVHLGFGAKGGTGFFGKLDKIEGDTAHITHDTGKTYKGPARFLSRG